MENQKYHGDAAAVILDTYGKIIADDVMHGFDEETKQKIRDSLKKPSLEKKPDPEVVQTERMLLWQKYLQNGTWERRSESGTEANYDTVDGRVKDEYIYNVGEIVTDACLILSGSVQIENVDVVGNKSILGVVRQGDIFAESYACIPNQPILVDVKTCEATEILFINVPALFVESNSCGHGAKLIQNLLRVSSRKNINLSMRIFHSASKTIRGRLISYFSEQVSVQGTNNIKIPLDRQQLADYLGVERTALSKELGKMRDDGLLTFHKNEFHVVTGEGK